MTLEVRLRRALILLGLALALGSCGGGAPRTGAPFRDRLPLPADTLTMPAPEIGRYGGRFVVAQTSPPKTFNAILSNESSSNDITRLMFAVLAEYDNGSQRFYPMLARSFESSADGLTWTWHLRRGACFSDGHPITSDDVLFSFAVAYDDSLHPSVRDLLRIGGEPIGLSAPDSHTVIMTIAKPFALMASAVGALRIMPRHVLEARLRAGTFASAYGVATPPESLVTSGPWRLRRYDPGERTVLERNPYWVGVDARGHRLPYLDEIVFLIVPDQATAALKFLSGEVDAVDNVKPEDYGTYAQRAAAGNYTLHEIGPSLVSNFVWFNLNTVRAAGGGKKVGDPCVGRVPYAWFSNPVFRRAVSRAIDRDAIIRGPYFGDAFKNWSTLTSGSVEWYSPEVHGDDYDPASARRLLASLGMRDRDGDGVIEDAGGHPVSFSLLTNSDNAVHVATNNLIRDDLQRVGIRVNPVTQDLNTLITHIRQDFQYEAISLGLGSSVPSDPGMAANFYRSSGIAHYWNVRQTAPATAAEREMDRLMDENVSTSDAAARHRTWLEMQRLMNRECFVVWLPSQVIRLPVRNGFGNVQPVPLPHRLLWNIDRVFVRSARPGT